MTDDELDEARAKTAFDADRNRTWQWAQLGPDYRATIIMAARLARENWQPTDPDLVLARGMVALEYRRREFSIAANETMAGARDDEVAIKAALAAIRAARGVST